jgi:hypothetical protein
MRDDLHKSVPTRPAWARVLRLACKQASEDELRDAIVRAVRKDAEWLMEPWGQQFERALDLGDSDLFAQDPVREALTALMASSPNPQARSACEIALGCLVREGRVRPDFKGFVMDQALRAFAEDCVELVSSWVAGRFGEQQAAQVRRRLRGLLPSCDLLRDPPRRRRGGDLSVEAVLDLPLSVSL